MRGWHGATSGTNPAKLPDSTSSFPQPIMSYWRWDCWASASTPALSETWAAPVLALTALLLTFSVYLVPLIELPLLTQILLAFALRTVVFPLDYHHSWWREVAVGSVIMILVTWWPRQKIIRTDYWLQPMMAAYALATVVLGVCAVHPHVSAQEWMVASSLLSLGYLAYGAWTRTWQFMVSGQIYLALAIWTFFNPPVGADNFPWTWWAAALPPAVVFLTGWFAHQGLPRFLTLSESARDCVSAAAYCYQALALGLAVRWIFGIVPAAEDTLAFFLLATGLLLWNMRWPSRFWRESGLIHQPGRGDKRSIFIPAKLSGTFYPAGPTRCGLHALSCATGSPAALGPRTYIRMGKLGGHSYFGRNGLALRLQFHRCGRIA